MSTRSRIAVRNPDGTLASIYCHFDDYPEGVGKTLVEHYTDPGKIAELIALGDLSVLGEDIGERQDFDSHTPGTCLAYGRDRGEACVGAAEHADEDALRRHAADGWEEYIYLWDDGEWRVAKPGGGSGPGLASRRDPTGELPLRWKPVRDVIS
jgi:hypothetical protein